MSISIEESRAAFLAQWARCYIHQRAYCALPTPPSQSDWNGAPTEFIPQEPMGNGAEEVYCETRSVYELMTGPTGAGEVYWG